MKRLDLVQLTIIIVGLFSAFFFINLVPGFLMYLFTWFGEGLRGGYMMEAFIGNILLLSMYLIVAIYAIKHSKHFAERICNNANLNADINFSLNKTELLYVLFTGLGVYGLIKNLPTLIVNGFNHIKNSNSSSLFEDNVTKTEKGDIAIQLITVLLFFILVYYAKVFADFFAAKINNTEPVDEIDNRTE